MTSDRARLPVPFSLYLDLVRFLAAMVVLFTHFRQFRLVSGPAAGFFPLAGHMAVVVFFVLSGFVIAYSTQSKHVTLREYAAARMTRIYSVALPMLVLAFGCAFLVAQLYGPALVPAYILNKVYIYLPLHLLFLGNAWTLSEVPPWLVPYWSLGYEAWYYVLFGALCVVRGRRRFVAGAVALAIMGPQIWLLLPVWMAGVWLYRWLETHSLPRRAARIGCLVTIALLAAFYLLDIEDRLKALVWSLWPFSTNVLHGNDRFLGDYIVCALVVVNFACARFAGFTALDAWAVPIRKLSFFTFPLYLCHALVLEIWRAFHPQQDGGPADFVLALLAIAVFTWVLGHGAERLRLAALAWIEARPRRPAASSWPKLADPLADPLAMTEDDTLQRIPRKF
jgi:peptidoglycan/LPS O-acetylase OafA/YrhL